MSPEILECWQNPRDLEQAFNPISRLCLEIKKLFKKNNNKQSQSRDTLRSVRVGYEGPECREPSHVLPLLPACVPRTVFLIVTASLFAI